MKLSGKVIAFAFISVLVFVTVIIIYLNYSPTDSKYFPHCIVKSLTGWSCPSCGVQRAAHSLLNGHLLEALSYNYFFFISIPYACLVCIAYGLRRINIAGQISEILEHKSLAMIYVYSFITWFFIRNMLNI